MRASYSKTNSSRWEKCLWTAPLDRNKRILGFYFCSDRTEGIWRQEALRLMLRGAQFYFNAKPAGIANIDLELRSH